jgi:putative tricarboxylic transport membrane protein
MDRIGAVALIVFGGFWVWQASRLPMGSADGGPGPGVLPSALGIGIVALAAISFLRPEVARIDLPYVRRIAMILGSLIGYALLLEPLGYVLATTLLLAFLLIAFAERRHWWQPVSALAISFATYYVFRILLSVPLPPDPLDLVR